MARLLNFIQSMRISPNLTLNFLKPNFYVNPSSRNFRRLIEVLLVLVLLPLNTHATTRSCLAIFMKEQAGKVEVNDFIRAYVETDLIAPENSHGVPALVLEGDQTDKTLIVSTIYNWPFAVKIPAKGNGFWGHLSTSQKRYLLGVIESTFSKNDYDSKHSSNIADLMIDRLGLNVEELAKRRVEAENNQININTEHLPKWVPKWFKEIVGVYKILQNPKTHGPLRDMLLEEIDRAPGTLSDVKGISARKVFSLAHNKQNCVGVCRHASEQMAMTLLEMGVPAEDIKIRSGLLFVPLSGHLWLQVKVNNQLKTVDPTPMGKLNFFRYIILRSGCWLGQAQFWLQAN